MPVVSFELSVAFALSITLAGCGSGRAQSPGAAIGNAKNGQRLLYAYGCGNCHVIPNIAEARGTLGPPLAGFASRYYMAGSLANTPDNLVNWIVDPQKIEPGNAMPSLGVTRRQAADMAAYLYSLR
jgi:cytochrome c2